MKRHYQLTYWNQSTKITVVDSFNNKNAAYSHLYENDYKPLYVKFIGWK